MTISLTTEYSRSLASLAGNDFQEEVAARLQVCIVDFQPVPSNPHGDGGVDGLSHRCEHAYCCYGLRHDEFKKPKERVEAIVEKFKEDLRRILELEIVDGKLKHSPNSELAFILPANTKIKHIQLITNWFDSHRILGPLNTAFAKYLKASKCRYVTKDATLNILGPNELAKLHAVDEVIIARARQRAWVQNVERKAQHVALASTEKFDKKMEDLKEISPGQVAAVETLKIELQKAWRRALAFEQELVDTLPGMHRDLEGDRARILSQVSMLMLSTGEPWTVLNKATEIASAVLKKDFDKVLGVFVEDLSTGEIARLIGECPVGWEKPSSNGN
jgi:hypothetical protein